MAIIRKKADYNEKESKDLIKTLKEKESKLFKTNMLVAQGKIKNVHESRAIRKDIARIKTVLRLKELEV
ncbi:50S ribosomal protein L29 [Patescibacteria group bacterium]|nr:50S ribosomal protein L29 [Patescibacteria group bacterium]